MKKIEVAGKEISVSFESVSMDDLLMVMNPEPENHVEYGMKVMEMIKKSISSEELSKIPINYMPFLITAMMQVLLEEVFGSLEVQSEIDEIVERKSNTD